MQLTADISMYPFNEVFIPPIDAFIARINTFRGLRVETGATSTIVSGEFEAVMRAVAETIARCTEEFGYAAYVVKYLPGDPAT